MSELIHSLVEEWRVGGCLNVANCATLLDKPSLIDLVLEMQKMNPGAPLQLAKLMREMQTQL